MCTQLYSFAWMLYLEESTPGLTPTGDETKKTTETKRLLTERNDGQTTKALKRSTRGLNSLKTENRKAKRISGLNVLLIQIQT